MNGEKKDNGTMTAEFKLPGVAGAVRGPVAAMIFLVLPIILAAALAGLLYINWQGFQSIERGYANATLATTALTRELVESDRRSDNILYRTMAARAQEHNDILCMLAVDSGERKLALRSGDVCQYVLGRSRQKPVSPE